jgi:hypothetical protein
MGQEDRMKFGNTLARASAPIVFSTTRTAAWTQDPGDDGDMPSPDHPVCFVLLHSPGTT